MHLQWPTGHNLRHFPVGRTLWSCVVQEHSLPFLKGSSEAGNSLKTSSRQIGTKVNKSVWKLLLGRTTEWGSPSIGFATFQKTWLATPQCKGKHNQSGKLNLLVEHIKRKTTPKTEQKWRPCASSLFVLFFALFFSLLICTETSQAKHCKARKCTVSKSRNDKLWVAWTVCGAFLRFS